MQVTREQLLKIARVGIYATIAFAAIVWGTSFRNAILISLCWIGGYLTEFCAVRYFRLFTKRMSVPKFVVVASFSAVVIDAYVIAQGYGIILAAACASFVLMDALILKFR